ncbi:ABC transporter, transmembrane domain, type 1 [Akanthomyces lecanii RCEF 1005]|uniref:ABC transporter, transmembrane domain, type 1 n=1 Tax=Akanthomyces lecanii RCEF 1005 TaxID=1081108 RepID=A0A168AW21_CORDF|nr:ABC transporter, transmembrane domain, type 1 [Akanthomyces lecanii RCEF 1005]
MIIDVNLRENAGHEVTSGAISRMLFLYLRPLFTAGFRKQLMLEDLDKLDPELAPQLLYKQLENFWHPYQRSAAVSRELFKASLKAWRQHLLPMGISRLILTAFRFSQPFLLHQIIIMVEKKDVGPFATAKRVGLVGATVFVFFGLTMTQSIFSYLMNRHVTRLRGGLVSFLFHKVHHLTEIEAKKVAAVTLMTADIDGIALGVPKALDIPFGILEISLGIFLLSRFVKIAALAVFAPVAVTSVATYFIGRGMATRFVAWNKCIEQRIAKTARLLPQLTTIKILGLGPSIAAYLKSLRVEEVDVSKKYRLLEAVAVAPVLLADLMTPVVVIAAALFGPAFHGRMAADKVFPTLTVVALIQSPLAGVLNVYPLITRMMSCFERIESFLLTAERKDSRKTTSSAAVSGSSVPLNSRVRFNNADLAKHGMQEALIRDANFQLPNGSTTAVVGRTGSGKSTIVQAILGESAVLNGSVEVDAEISYCAQTIWLQDTTIRQNVIGYLEYDAIKFKKVMHACALEDDIGRLPGGVDYVVGPNGSNLSGGQRQRLAIARAAYVAAEVTILDDVFSSLDHDTAVAVLHRLCGRGGIFQETGCTVVLVTYLPDCVDVCSHVLFLNGDGSVTLRDDPRSPAFLDHILATLNTVNTDVPTSQNGQERNAVGKSLQVVQTPTPIDSDPTRRKGNLGLYRMFIDPIGRLNSFLYGLFVSLLSAGEALPEVYIRVWVELHPDNSLYFLGYISVTLGTCVVACMVYWLMHGKLSPRSSITLHSMLVDRTMGATLRFLSMTTTGHLLNFYNQDMMLLSRNLPASFIRTIYAGAFVFFQIGIILSGASYLAISIPFLATAVYFIQRYYLRTSRQIRLLDLEMKAPLHTYFGETATGLSHIQAFSWEEKSIERGLEFLAESQRPYYVMMTIQQWLVLVLGLMTGSLAVLLVTLALFIKQASSQTAVGLSFLSLLSLNKTFAATIIAWTALEVSKGALSRLFNFREKTPQEPKVSQEPLPAVWPCSGKVQLTNVVARFRPEDEEAEPVLDDISLSVCPGQRVGIVGRSGSGKSALLLTLLGFVDYEGVVEIDGINIASVSRDDLRSRLITITQDQFCFEGTVRTNLLPGIMNDLAEKSVDEKEKAALKDDELEQLLKSLQIWTQIAGKGGLEAVLDEVGYSKGELQLLCIARAILKQRDTSSKLVLVDEATSSVDAETEEIVNKVMTEYFSDCTMIIVAHRKSSLDNVHTIIEINQGKVVGVEHPRTEREPLQTSPPDSS